MKILNKILLVTSLSLVIVGCSDDRLDITPTDSIGIDQADKSEASLEGVKNGMYYKLSYREVFGRDIIVAGDLISDDSFVSVNNSNRFTTTNSMNYIEATNELVPIDYLYDAYIHANTVINSKLPETDNVKQIKAEAYVGKALVLFYAVNLYSPSIASGMNQEYGVPLFTDNYDPNITYPRSSVPEVYAEIESNLQQALTLFQGEPGNKQFFGPTAAKLLLSRVYLYQQKWQQAYDYASQVETVGGAFQAVDKDGYVSYFTTVATGAPETVFEIGYSKSNSQEINHIAGVYAKDGAYKQNEFRKSLYDLYDASDVRRDLLIFDESNFGKNIERGYFTDKYTIKGDYVQSIKILRMSEAKLNKIEALYHLGNEAQALSELNAFVATRGTYSYSSTGAQLLSDILKERRLEFVAEGHRFFDLKRNMLPIIKDSNCNNNCNVEATSHLFVLPMPRWEIINNPQMKQYPGY